MFGVFIVSPLYVKAAATATVTPSKTEISAAETLNFTFVVDNSSGTTALTELSVWYGTTKMTDGGSVEAGEKKNLTFSMLVSADMIGQTLTFTLKSSGTTVTTASTVVRQAAAAAKLNFKVTVNRSAAPVNTDVVFTITLENTGTVQLKNLQLYLTGISNSAIKFAEVGGGMATSVASLNPTEKKTMTYTYSLTTGVTVTPTIKYTVNGAAGEQSQSPLTLSVADPNMTVVITPDVTSVSPQGQVKFTVKITNTGNLSFKDVTVYDYLQQKISNPRTLGSGGSFSVTTTIPFETSTAVTFSVTATDQQEIVYTYKSNKVQINVPLDTSKIAIQLEAIADPASLKTPGKVTFKITATNEGDYILSDAVITEPTLGEIGTLTSFGRGPKYFEKTVDVTASGTYTFTLTAQDALGNSYTATADPIDVTLGSTSSETDDPYANAVDVKPKTDVITIIIISLVVAIAVVSIILGVIIKNERGRSSKGKARFKNY